VVLQGCIQFTVIGMNCNEVDVRHDHDLQSVQRSTGQFNVMVACPQIKSLEMDSKKSQLKYEIPSTKKLQSEVIRQRHNSSHKNYQIEFDLNSLPKEEFGSVISDELNLKEKGVRQSFQISNFQKSSELEVNKQIHLGDDSTKEVDSIRTADESDQYFSTPSKPQSQISTTSYVSENSGDSPKVHSPSVNPLATGTSSYQTATRISGEEPWKSLHAVSRSEIQPSQYRAIKEPNLEAPQHYVAHQKTLIPNQSEKFTSSLQSQSVTVFDWDDTLFCTSFLEEVKGTSLQRTTVHGREIAELDKYTVRLVSCRKNSSPKWPNYAMWS
jgi:hypothetical protein